MKKSRKTDLLFTAALLLVFLLHLYFVLFSQCTNDESYYAVLPYRLVNGDSLIQHEWHLTQFSALFSYLPVYIWTAIKGSTDGVFIFLRLTYLLIHTIIAIIIYKFFKKYGNWAIMASMIFFIQVPYRIMAISYHSMFVIFLLLLSLCLLSIYKKQSICFYVFAGMCFACCCICNPLVCSVFILYLVGCVLWKNRESLKHFVIQRKVSNNYKKQGKLTKRQKRQLKQIDIFPNMEDYTCFFNKRAIVWITCGIVIVAVIAVAFFFLTGGTINSLLKNIENLFSSSEYDFMLKSVFSKFFETLYYFSHANLGMPWLLPILFIALMLDKNRKLNTHRAVYLSISLLWSIIFVIAIIKEPIGYSCAVSLPFFVISTICYCLTENKNKTLFYCMYLPCLVFTFIHYLAADTHWAAIGIVLAISNIAGVFFTMDLYKEMRFVIQNDSVAKTEKKQSKLCQSIMVLGFCIQMLFFCAFDFYGQMPEKDAVKVTNGPFSGIYMKEDQYSEYSESLEDMDIIKNISEQDEPVLLASYDSWMYLYLERPIATYTTWYRGTIEQKLLTNYYEANHSKIPEYIYIDASKISAIDEMFEYTEEELSNGTLLTVKECNF